MRSHRQQFTFVELLVSMAVVTIIIGMLIAILFLALNVSEVTTEGTTVLGKINRILFFIDREVTMTKKDDISVSTSGITLKPDFNNDDTSDYTVNYSYNKANATLLRHQSSLATQTILTNLASFSYSQKNSSIFIYLNYQSENFATKISTGFRPLTF